MRVIVWYSCGASSAVAAKLALREYKGEEIHIVYCDTGGEHPDNKRFLRDCEQWFNHPIEILKNQKYQDHFDVANKTKYIVSPSGARCTVELKKRLRFAYQEPDDIQIMGFTYDPREMIRAQNFNEHFFEITTDWILIGKGLNKEQCKGIIWRNGLKLPAMYEMGYDHNNCLGCFKGGAGYWNKIRVDFPEVFQKAAILERKIGARINDVFLDELNPKSGNFKAEKNISCDFMCDLALQEINSN